MVTNMRHSFTVIMAHGRELYRKLWRHGPHEGSAVETFLADLKWQVGKRNGGGKQVLVHFLLL